jgi:hypothetical protein
MRLRKAMKVTAAVLVVAAVLMIVVPRIWVKNKKARLIYNGHTQEDFTLYHGKGGRLLLVETLPGEAPAMLYDPARGVASCGPGAFLDLKLVRFESQVDSRCTWFREAKEAHVGGNALRFNSPRGVAVEVEWQPAPR